ncbi:DUF1828 domain-containing protein [Xanthomonas hydrangeae]|uniref:DUF1828 domain-containing protein n=1 Tax=Xanthomonas hydrangeae TaxID=2775159 RepID=A0AAU0BGB2_9XANT|nr:DUF1828 domain-containing protein [Xanthomonas hydrangeae]WOB51016.1 DUF1828 domain-containing protein [Xanthomonas hydrangeae]
MSYQTIAASIGGSYTRLSDVSGYINSPLVMPEDGTMIGAYLIDAPGNQVRITDDANVLYRASLHGVSASPSRSKQIQAVAESLGLALSEDGELHVTCAMADASFYLVRFLEAADRIAYLSLGFRPKGTSRFEHQVADALQEAFPHGVVRHATVTGASGHALRFPFMLEGYGEQPTVIQSVAAKDGKIDWGGVYQAVGKFIDLKNNPISHLRRVTVLEGMRDQSVEQAKAALADASSVIVFHDRQQFIEKFRRAA